MALRIVLIGQAAFGSEVLSGLVREGHAVVAVYCPPDTGGRPDPLKEKAGSLGLRVLQPSSFKNDEVKNEFRAHAPDLAVLAYVTRIVPMEIISAPRLGSICFHPSLLPRHRGGSAINWTLICGDEETGVSVFWPDAGIDTGPLLLQKRVEVGPDDSAGSLYYDKLFPLGVEAMIEAVRLIELGQAPRIPQREDQATYEPLCRDEHAGIRWERPAQVVHNLIRGCDPRPGAYVDLAACRLRLFGSSVAEAAEPAAPGTVVDISSDGLLVKTAEGAVRIRQARRGEGPKEKAAEVALALGLKVGDRLL